MKVTVENSKGLEKNIKVLIDKKIIASQLDQKYDEIKKDVVLKGFRPGKVPKDILKRQFGKAVYGEVIDKILKDTTTKALDDNKIKPAGQPKIDLKSFGEGKDLEYTILVTELPKVDLKLFDNIKFDDYVVKIDQSETEKRINQIAKTQNNFENAKDDQISKEGDLIIFDYEAKVDGKEFKNNKGSNTQIVLGKDIFIKGFDKQLIGAKKNENKIVNVKLPENFPDKDVANKEATFNCKIQLVKIPKEIKIDDEFAKNLGAKDLNNLKEIISKQINDEFKNSLDLITKRKILDQIDNYKISEIPKSLIEQEIKIITQGMKEDDIKKRKKELDKEASKRIKIGLFLSAYGQEKEIKVSNEEINSSLGKQMGMMPGQEKIVQEYYQKNPAALDSLRGNIYEEKIIEEIKKNANKVKKEITKSEAEKILKEENEKNLKEQSKFSPHNQNKNGKKDKKQKKDDAKDKQKQIKKTKTQLNKNKNLKKVSKK